MTAPNPEPTSFVIAERGGDWATWVERFQRSTPDVAVVVQEPGESVGDLAMRVRARVAALEEDGGAVDQAVLVGGGRTDSEAISARSLVLRALTAPMVAAGAGIITLDGQGRDRYAMMALASTVSPMVMGTGVSIAPAANDVVAPAASRFADVA
ncbi:MAG: hypothetical protein AAGH15_08900 [Myxococcota bacterium]